MHVECGCAHNTSMTLIPRTARARFDKLYNSMYNSPQTSECRLGLPFADCPPSCKMWRAFCYLGTKKASVPYRKLAIILALFGLSASCCTGILHHFPFTYQTPFWWLEVE